MRSCLRFHQVGRQPLQKKERLIKGGQTYTLCFLEGEIFCKIWPPYLRIDFLVTLGSSIVYKTDLLATSYDKIAE